MAPRLLTQAPAAAAVLAAGGLVALPTETVYGLAAAADDPAAVARVFAVKGRPVSHPLIVHLASPRDVGVWAREVPESAQRLIAQAWPGPLTIVLPKQPWVPVEITGGQDTVALRVPAHKATRDVIDALGEVSGRAAAVVAPSANRYGAVSPTTAAHVLDGLGKWLLDSDAILDGGPCRIGVESTIVDVAAGVIRVLRPGGYPITDTGADAGAGAAVPRVPGAVASHYAPRAKVRVMDAPMRLRPDVVGDDLRIGLIAPHGVATPLGWHRLAAPPDDRAYARQLYAALREADERGLTDIVAVPPSDGPLVAAIRDRLRRAAATAD